MFSPVANFRDDEVQAEIYAVIKNIRDNADFVRATDRGRVIGTVFAMLVAGVICLKHEGFREEYEWRVIYGPKRNPSPIMEAESEIKTIGGVPRPIYKMPLDAAVSPAVAGLDVASIFDRLIIGPSQYSLAMHQAFAAALTKAGVADAGKRVIFRYPNPRLSDEAWPIGVRKPSSRRWSSIPRCAGLPLYLSDELRRLDAKNPRDFDQLEHVDLAFTGFEFPDERVRPL
jgi:hypothetical protein